MVRQLKKWQGTKSDKENQGCFSNAQSPPGNTNNDDDVSLPESIVEAAELFQNSLKITVMEVFDPQPDDKYQKEPPTKMDRMVDSMFQDDRSMVSQLTLTDFAVTRKRQSGNNRTMDAKGGGARDFLCGCFA